MTGSLCNILQSVVFTNEERWYFNVLCSNLWHLNPSMFYCVVYMWRSGELCVVEFVEDNVALGQVLIRLLLCFSRYINPFFIIHLSVFPENPKGSNRPRIYPQALSVPPKYYISRDLRSSAMLRSLLVVFHYLSVRCLRATLLPGFLTLEDGNDRLSRNVGGDLSLYAA